MANILVIHFVSGETVRLEGDIATLGPTHKTATGYIEWKIPDTGGGVKVYWINPEQIAYIEDYGAAETGR